MVITGGGSGLTYQPNANYCNSQAGATPDTFTYTLNGGDSATVSVTVTCVDDAPTAVDDSATVVEDSGAAARRRAGERPRRRRRSDHDRVGVGSGERHGRPIDRRRAPGLTYQPDANYSARRPDTFTYTLNGGSTATVSMTVTCAPDDPVVDTSAGSTSYTENAAATVIDAAVTVTDPDAGTTITGATVKITGGYAGAEDILALAGTHPGITAAFSGDTLTLSGNASVAAYQAALRAVTYSNSSDAPSTAARTVTFTVTDDTRPERLGHQGHHGQRGRRSAGGGRRQRDGARGRGRDRGHGAHQRHRRRRRAEVDRVGHAAGQRHGGHHRRRDRADVSAERELLQHPAGHDAEHVHVHAQRRLDRRRCR